MRKNSIRGKVIGSSIYGTDKAIIIIPAHLHLGLRHVISNQAGIVTVTVFLTFWILDT